MPSEKLQLREYQQDLLARTKKQLAKDRCTLMVLPTGGGKTVIFCYMIARAAERQKRTLVLVHRQELLQQVSDTLTRFGVEHQKCAPNEKVAANALVTVASVFSAVRRLDSLPAPDLVVIDEAHHCVKSSTWGAVLEWAKGAYCVGVTATPQRLSGEGMRECFSAMVQGPTTAELMEQGHLCDYKYFRPPGFTVDGIRTTAGDFNSEDAVRKVNTAAISGCAVSHYEQHANGKRAVVFCITVGHANDMANRFLERGHRAKVLNANTPKAERVDIVRQFNDNEIQILCSCNVISEGFDLPAIECAILLRPTKSVSMYLQQVGRALRTAPNKQHAVILDHVGNVDRHGLPCDDRDWSLDGRKKKKSQTGEAAIATRVCSSCFAVNRATADTCVVCGFTLVKSRSLKIDESSKLVEMRRGNFRPARIDRLREQREATTLPALIALAKRRGYKWPVAWATHIMKARYTSSK
jgi:DNA repair protein RadD